MKTYKLNPKPVGRDGKEVEIESEDRTIVIKEEIEQTLLDQLPESVRNEVNLKSEERVTIANLKQEHTELLDSAKASIKRANKIAEKINAITGQFPDLSITGKPLEILDEDKIIDIDSKKATLRQKR